MDWDGFPLNFVAGKDIVVANYDNDERWLLKFHVIVKDNQYYYVPLPRDKQELKHLLVQIAHNEGIEL